GGGGGGGGYTLPIASADTIGGVKIGDGLEIAESGVLSVDNQEPQNALFYLPDGDIGWQVIGDFEKCLDAIKNNKPFKVQMFEYSNNGGSGTNGYSKDIYDLIIIYDPTKPNEINLMITGGVGFIWTANGVEFYD
ncbi:MAG: hypothetical protein IK117_12435, partial [Bacteroidales bacterium]|nr:hypothetical protein [Bacteroidales bacterium]